MQPTSILLKTERLLLSPVTTQCVAEVLAYYRANRAHLQPWEPRRSEDFYTTVAMAQRLAGMVAEMAQQRAVYLLLRETDGGQLIGECALTNIVRGPFLACHLGFSIDHAWQGKGLMHEGLQAVMQFAFSPLGLHRVMANYRPENTRSHRLLQRLGFEKEGYARAYLNIDGQWRDHLLTALIKHEAG